MDMVLFSQRKSRACRLRSTQSPSGTGASAWRCHQCATSPLTAKEREAALVAAANKGYARVVGALLLDASRLSFFFGRYRRVHCAFAG
eukprot:scaffold152984_cov35-Tisochrysis_lutea.AAC.1